MKADILRLPLKTVVIRSLIYLLMDIIINKMVNKFVAIAEYLVHFRRNDIDVIL